MHRITLFWQTGAKPNPISVGWSCSCGKEDTGFWSEDGARTDGLNHAIIKQADDERERLAALREAS